MKLALTLFTLFCLSQRIFAAETPEITLTNNNIPPPFSASYQLEKGLLPVGVLDVTLETSIEKGWIYQSSLRAIGVAKLFLGKEPVTDRSELAVFNHSIFPTVFKHIQIKGGEDRSQLVLFDWQEMTAQAKYKEKDRSIDLQKNMFDNFSVQLLLMANIHHLPDEFTLPVISKAKHKTFKFYKVGLVKLSTRFGLLDTLLIERRKENKKNSTYRIWAALDSFGLPVQIEKIENGKSQYLAKILTSSLLQN